jgi:polysaccharide deacetylase family protein (PEP-CTERM system associated)
MKILTFDIEEWFHLLDEPSTESISQWERFPVRIHENVDRLLELLSRLDSPATFFCLGWIAEKHPDVVRKIADSGYEIGSHSHLHPLVYKLAPKEFVRDLDRSIKTLEDVTGRKVRAYRAPGFSITKSSAWAFDLLVQHGIEIDCSLFLARRAHGGFSDWKAAGPQLIRCSSGFIKEFPVLPQSLLGMSLAFSGGGYFRLLPYPVIKHMIGRTDYVMTYFHPRDFDANQPKIRLPRWRKFKAYVGLRTAQAKLERLVRAYDFVSLKQGEEQVNWASAPMTDISGEIVASPLRAAAK